MKIAIVGTVGVPACYGGFESLVENLTHYASDSVCYHVICSSNAYDEKMTHYNGAELSYLPLKANGVQSIPYDILSLLRCLYIKPDVTLILGVSGCLFLPIYKLLSSSKIVTNIDGLEWKRDKWGVIARTFLKFSEAVAVKFSDIIVADNQAIGDYVISEYGKSNQIIAYGGDHVIPSKPEPVEVQDYYFSLCRIEPENNVEMILEAFSNIKEQLKFVGNWESSDYGRNLKAKFSRFDNIELIDPVYELETLYSLRAGCRGYIHGHSAGGTNPSLVEAMHFAKTIFAFDCNFNRYSTENKACYFSSAQDLINRVVGDDEFEERLSKGFQMKEIASRRYTWHLISKQYESLY